MNRYGADGFAYATQGTLATVIFVMENRQMRFVLELPDPDDFRLTNHSPPRERSQKAQQEAHCQACRQKWRALLLVVSRAAVKHAIGAGECRTTWVMPDGHGLAGGVGGLALTGGPALALR